MTARWEKGYRVHGLWKRTACPDCDGTGHDDPPPGKCHGICPRCNGKGMYMQRMAFVSIPPKHLGGAKVNGYHWEVSDGKFGVEKTLKKAKLACEQLLQGEL